MTINWKNTIFRTLQTTEWTKVLWFYSMLLLRMLQDQLILLFLTPTAFSYCTIKQMKLEYLFHKCVRQNNFTYYQSTSFDHATPPYQKSEYFSSSMGNENFTAAPTGTSMSTVLDGIAMRHLPLIMFLQPTDLVSTHMDLLADWLLYL